MTNVSPLKPHAMGRLAHIDATLEAAYGTPEVELGNKDDPLDESIYIVLSFQTNLARFCSTWSQLRAAFPTWDLVEQATETDVALAIREGGLQRQKTRTIQRLLREVRRVSGQLSLNMLRELGDEDAEKVLARLPGLSWKGARCVLLYSLGRKAFPIDGNTFRILKRTGVLARSAVYRRRCLHDELQAAVRSDRRRAFHVNLVVHGQRICLSRAPKCEDCPLLSTCPQIGIARKKQQRAELVHATAAQPAAPTMGCGSS